MTNYKFLFLLLATAGVAAFAGVSTACSQGETDSGQPLVVNDSNSVKEERNHIKAGNKLYIPRQSPLRSTLPRHCSCKATALWPRAIRSCNAWPAPPPTRRCSRSSTTTAATCNTLVSNGKPPLNSTRKRFARIPTTTRHATTCAWLNSSCKNNKTKIKTTRHKTKTTKTTNKTKTKINKTKITNKIKTNRTTKTSNNKTKRNNNRNKVPTKR